MPANCTSTSPPRRESERIVTTERKKHHPIRRAKRQDRTEPEPSYGQNSGPRGGRARYGAARRPDEVVEPLAPRRERRALSHVGGDVFFQGGRDEDREVLLKALDVSADEAQVMMDVHGFHSYPARLHPHTARGLIEGFSQPGDRVLDPFCGSGTVVVEGRALGREAIGSDLNPLAVELSWLKSRGPTQRLVNDMVRAAASIAEVAEDRRLAKADPYHRYSHEDRLRYPIHILLELDSIAHGIGLVSQTEVVRMLRLVVSSTLTKLSHSEGDTTRQRSQRRLPSGFAIQLFHKKAEELAQRFHDYGERVVDRAPRAYVGSSDARDLESVESDSVNLIITSPPYPGVYDYLDHHLHRIEWLGLRASRLRDGEIGARREYKYMGLEEAAARWRSEIGPTLLELKRILSPEGRGVMIIADSVVDRQALRADEQIRQVAERAGIDITCIASQERPLFLHGADRVFARGPRMEHVVVFRPKAQKRRHEKEMDKDLAAANADRIDHEDRPDRFDRFDETQRDRAEREAPRDNNRGGYQNRDNNRGGYQNRDDNRGGYQNRDDNRGGYQNRDDNRGGYQNRDDNRGGYQNRDDNRGGYQNRDDNRGGYQNRDDNRSGYQNRDDNRGGYQNRERSERPRQRDSQERTWDSSPRGADSSKEKPD